MCALHVHAVCALRVHVHAVCALRVRVHAVCALRVRVHAVCALRVRVHAVWSTGHRSGHRSCWRSLSVVHCVVAIGNGGDCCSRKAPCPALCGALMLLQLLLLTPRTPPPRSVAAARR